QPRSSPFVATQMLKPSEMRKTVSQMERAVPLEKNARARNAAIAATQKRRRKRELNISLCGSRSAAYESIAYADDSFDAAAARIQLLPQTPDVHVECTCISVIAIAPNLVEQLLPRNYAILFLCERGQE